MKVDLLQFVTKTISGFETFIEEQVIETEPWLTIWYKQNRVKPICIRRFVSASNFGKLLGQLQAEGTKSKITNDRLEFCNKNLFEHKEYVTHLEELGISKAQMCAQVSFRNGFQSQAIIKDYETLTGVKVKYITKSGQRGDYGFRTYVRSTILTSVILGALLKIRRHLAQEKWSDFDKEIADTFFAKLLTGDGTLDIQVNNREYDFPYVRIKVVDKEKEYREDYASIMKRLGFHPHISDKHISVRSGCSLNNLLYLYKIRAFENTNNWNKLLLIISMYLQGRRHRTFLRYLELRNKTFTSLDLMKNYCVRLRTANDWLANHEKEGLVKKIRKSPYPAIWSTTQKAIELANALESWQKELDPLLNLNKTKRLSEILDTLKVKSKLTPNHPKRAPILGLAI